MCNCITAHARLYDYHLVRAAPRHPANASRPAKIPRTAHRSRTRQTENRGAPRLWRGSDFVIDDGTGKHWGWWLVSRSEANHLQDGFLLFTKSG